jgi:hypothetical protein
LVPCEERALPWHWLLALFVMTSKATGILRSCFEDQQGTELVPGRIYNYQTLSHRFRVRGYCRSRAITKLRKQPGDTTASYNSPAHQSRHIHPHIPARRRTRLGTPSLSQARAMSRNPLPEKATVAAPVRSNCKFVFFQRM